MRAIAGLGLALLVGCANRHDATWMEVAVDQEYQTYPWPFEVPAWAEKTRLAADVEEPDRSDEATVAFEYRLLRWPRAATSDEWRERLALVGLLDQDVAMLGERQLDALVRGPRDRGAQLLQAPRIIVRPQQCASVFVGRQCSTVSSGAPGDRPCGPGTRVYLEATEVSPTTITFRFALQAAFALRPDGAPQRCSTEHEITLDSGAACATLVETVGSDDAHIVVIRAAVLPGE